MNCDLAKSLLTQREGPHLPLLTQSNRSTDTVLVQTRWYKLLHECGTISTHTNQRGTSALNQWFHRASEGPETSGLREGIVKTQLYKVHAHTRGPGHGSRAFWNLLLPRWTSSFCAHVLLYILLRSITYSSFVPLIYLRLVRRFQLNFIVDQVYKTY